jgi:ABC-type spermidine/putrescine transport system permease subunit I
MMMNSKLKNNLVAVCLLLLIINGYGWGIGQLAIVLYTETAIFDITNQAFGSAYNMTVALSDFRTVAVGGLWVGVESVICCSIATFAVTYLILNKSRFFKR